MVEIYNNVFIGDENDYECNVKYNETFNVIQACKEPYHRKAIGYKGRACDSQNPEYLFAIRDNRLILNLIDGKNHEYVSKIIIDKAIRYINESLNSGKKVLIHCNKGESRSASIGLLFLAHKGVFKGDRFDIAERKYKEIYPKYSPSEGINKFCYINWEKYNR